MRPLLLPGLLDAARHNAARGAGALALFESPARLRPERSPDAPEGSPGAPCRPRRRHHLAGLLTRRARHLAPRAGPADFFAAKGLVEACSAPPPGWSWRSPPRARARSCIRAARRRPAAGGREIGWIGELHPLVAREWDLEGGAAFELDFDALAEEAPRADAVRGRDQLPGRAPGHRRGGGGGRERREVTAAVREGGGDLLAGAEVFDVYEGEQVGEGNRSLALRLEFRAPDRTLTDEEVAERAAARSRRRWREIGGQLRA